MRPESTAPRPSPWASGVAIHHTPNCEPSRGFFAKEDGEVIIGEKDERIGRQA
jgi:hypothetical protein